MNFLLTEQQRLIQNLAREFARREIVPLAARADQEARFPMVVHERMRALGLANLTIPTAFGGDGLGVVDLALVTEQLSWACTGITGAVGINSILADVFHSAGTEAQKRLVFDRLRAGGWGAYAVTEPGAGSDVAAIQTRADKRKGRYLINGSKVWISLVPS